MALSPLMRDECTIGCGTHSCCVFSKASVSLRPRTSTWGLHTARPGLAVSYRRQARVSPAVPGAWRMGTGCLVVFSMSASKHPVFSWFPFVSSHTASWRSGSSTGLSSAGIQSGRGMSLTPACFQSRGAKGVTICSEKDRGWGKCPLTVGASTWKMRGASWTVAKGIAWTEPSKLAHLEGSGRGATH